MGWSTTSGCFRLGERLMIYTTFAQLYDELMDPDMYANWLDLVKTQLPANANLLDLACGSGRLAVSLAQNGYQVAGLDLSEEMLALADYHARQAGVELELYQGDMTDLSQLENYEYVTCFADSLCYLPTQADLQACFQAVYQHLEPGGKFLFDVITPYKTDVVYPDYMYNYSDEEQAFLWNSYSGQDEHSVIHDLTFFIYDDKKAAYERLSELHYERTYPLVTYKTMLAQAGFKQVEVSADFARKEATENDERWFFICQK